MKAKEKAVREAAAALNTAIAEATAAGYHINWPLRSDGLATLEISEGAGVEADDAAEAPEASAPEHRRPHAK